MLLSDALTRYPRSFAFIAEKRGHNHAALANRVLGPVTGSGNRRDYTAADIRLIIAQRVMTEGLARLGVPHGAGSRSDRIIEQLRDQVRENMPDALKVYAADVSLAVGVPFIIVAELNALATTEREPTHGEEEG
jgi:hypothetical protein